MKKSLLITFLSTLLLAFVSVAQASEPMKIRFNDLQGKIAPYADPFADLTSDQLYNLSIYARIQKMQEIVPERVTQSMIDDAESAKQSLEEDKIDIEYLFAQREIIMEKRKQAAMATNPLLADKVIEMGGYMLPLEFNNGKVSEFLLVPTIGACSHKPVPAPNQILLVRTAEPIEVGNTYMPVRVTGTLRITPQTKELFLVDGQKGINMSYTIEAANVEPYLG
ncbi:MAG: DUF3299 domain-containing protein [Psychromonas sp.]